MHRILAVAENTLKESLRQRILALLAVFSVLLPVVSVFLSPFALGEASKLLRDFGLGVSSLLAVMTVIITGSQLIYKDIERRTIYCIVTRPVRRWEILLGKFLGAVVLVALLLVGMAVIQQALIVVLEGRPDLKLLLNIPFSLLEITVLSAIMLFLSAFSTPGLTSILAVIFFIIGHAAPDIKLFAEQSARGLLKLTAYLVYYILPNFENFNYRLELVHGLPLYADRLLFAVSYGVLYTVLVLYLATVVFETREFK